MDDTSASLKKGGADYVPEPTPAAQGDDADSSSQQAVVAGPSESRTPAQGSARPKPRPKLKVPEEAGSELRELLDMMKPSDKKKEIERLEKIGDEPYEWFRENTTAKRRLLEVKLLGMPARPYELPHAQAPVHVVPDSDAEAYQPSDEEDNTPPSVPRTTRATAAAAASVASDISSTVTTAAAPPLPPTAPASLQDGSAAAPPVSAEGTTTNDDDPSGQPHFNDTGEDDREAVRADPTGNPSADLGDVECSSSSPSRLPPSRDGFVSPARRSPSPPSTSEALRGGPAFPAATRTVRSTRNATPPPSQPASLAQNGTTAITRAASPPATASLNVTTGPTSITQTPSFDDFPPEAAWIRTMYNTFANATVVPEYRTVWLMLLCIWVELEKALGFAYVVSMLSVTLPLSLKHSPAIRVSNERPTKGDRGVDTERAEGLCRGG